MTIALPESGGGSRARSLWRYCSTCQCSSLRADIEAAALGGVVRCGVCRAKMYTLSNAVRAVSVPRRDVQQLAAGGEK